MYRRFQGMNILPHGSADSQRGVVDVDSDNYDVLLMLDPQEMLSEASRAELERLVSEALNAARFRPFYAEAR